MIFIYLHTIHSGIIGWPTNEPLPDRFRLISAQIYEPNALINSEGAIYLWVADMDEL